MTNAFLMFIFEALKVMFFKMATKAVFERFLTRLILWAGDKLVLMTSNTLDDATWLDMKLSLTGKGLKVADQRVEAEAEQFDGGWSE